ncbi:MAG: hypothetical protein ABSF15_19760 [Candidatus Sulfotelmatobacter sp.]
MARRSPTLSGGWQGLLFAKQLGHAVTRMVEIHYGHLAPNYVVDTIRAAAPKLGILNPTLTTNTPEKSMRVQ